MNLIADRLKFVMGSHSVRKFAECLNMSPTTVHEYLKGRVPPADFIVRVCDRFGVDPRWLLTGEGNRGTHVILQDGQINIGYSAPKKIHSKAAAIKRIVIILEGMTYEKVFDILKYTEEKKELLFYQAIGRGHRTQKED